MYIEHSAEGSTWTKKNHKYIRKEGNRYIYPKDVTAKSNEAKAQSHAKASNMPANEARQLSQQRANRKAAANGGPSKHSVLYYNKNTKSLDSDYYTSDQEWAKDRTSKGSGRSIRTKEQLNQKKRSKALNSQGSVNRQQQAKEFKEYQDWEKADAKKRSSETKRKEALNKQGSKQYRYNGELYGIRDKNGRQGVREQVSQQDAKEMSRINSHSSYQQLLRQSNKEKNKPINKLKNKGKKAVDKLIGRFKKK